MNRHRGWVALWIYGFVLAFVAAVALLQQGCRALSIYVEDHSMTFSGPKGGSVRAQDAEGYTVGVMLDIGKLMPPSPQPVYLVRDAGAETPWPPLMPSSSWPASVPAQEIWVPDWVDPHRPAHDFPDEPEPTRCRGCGATRAEASTTDGEA